MVVLFTSAALDACVEQTTVISDEWSRLACENAALVEAPTSGCRTLVVEASSTSGCRLHDDLGHWIADLRGSWVRLRRPEDLRATLRVRTLERPPECADAGLLDCTVAIDLTTFDDAPCTCSVSTLHQYTFDLESEEIELVSIDQEMLLLADRGTFEVSLCAIP